MTRTIIHTGTSHTIPLSINNDLYYPLMKKAEDLNISVYALLRNIIKHHV